MLLYKYICPVCILPSVEFEKPNFKDCSCTERAPRRGMSVWRGDDDDDDIVSIIYRRNTSWDWAKYTGINV